MVDIDWPNLTDAELKQVQEEAAAEFGRRQIPKTINKLNTEYLVGEGVSSGDAWRQPVGGHDAYPVGWVVTHNGTTWQSLIAANVWEPPTNWREVAANGTPVWVQPVGTEDAYPMGSIVSYKDQTWISVVPANVWEPGVYGWEVYETSTPPAEEYPAWVQPTGSHDAYALDAKVSHAEKRWTSAQDANIWEPGVAGWDEVVEA